MAKETHKNNTSGKELPPIEILPEKTTVETLPSSTFQSADLAISKLIESDVDVDKLEKLLEIKGKYEAEENKKAFQLAFSKLQSDLPVIEKTKEVWNKEKTYIVYKYAPLEKIVEQIKPAMAKYGFSFRWSEGLTEKENYKRIYCHIQACGHEEVNFCDIPIMAANKMINNAQQAGVSSTYGKRYSLIGALGIMADDDTDGHGMNYQQSTPPPAKPTEKPKTHAELVAEFTLVYQKFAAMRDPGDTLNTFMANVEMETDAEIIKGINGVNFLINKYSKKDGNTQ